MDDSEKSVVTSRSSKSKTFSAYDKRGKPIVVQDLTTCEDDRDDDDDDDFVFLGTASNSSSINNNKHATRFSSNLSLKIQNMLENDGATTKEETEDLPNEVNIIKIEEILDLRNATESPYKPPKLSILPPPKIAAKGESAIRTIRRRKPSSGVGGDSITADSAVVMADGIDHCLVNDGSSASITGSIYHKAMVEKGILKKSNANLATNHDPPGLDSAHASSAAPHTPLPVGRAVFARVPSPLKAYGGRVATSTNAQKTSDGVRFASPIRERKSSLLGAPVHSRKVDKGYSRVTSSKAIGTMNREAATNTVRKVGGSTSIESSYNHEIIHISTMEDEKYANLARTPSSPTRQMDVLDQVPSRDIEMKTISDRIVDVDDATQNAVLNDDSTDDIDSADKNLGKEPDGDWASDNDSNAVLYVSERKDNNEEAKVVKKGKDPKLQPVNEKATQKDGMPLVRLGLLEFTNVVRNTGSGDDDMEHSVKQLVQDNEEEEDKTQAKKVDFDLKTYSRDLALSDDESSDSSTDVDNSGKCSPDDSEDVGHSGKHSPVDSEDAEHSGKYSPADPEKWVAEATGQVGGEESDHGDSYASMDDNGTDAMSNVDSVAYEDREYESFTLPYVVQMLDRSCAWFEDRQSSMPCSNKEPSLLDESSKKRSTQLLFKASSPEEIEQKQKKIQTNSRKERSDGICKGTGDESTFEGKSRRRRTRFPKKKSSRHAAKQDDISDEANDKNYQDKIAQLWIQKRVAIKKSAAVSSSEQLSSEKSVENPVRESITHITQFSTDHAASSDSRSLTDSPGSVSRNSAESADQGEASNKRVLHRIVTHMDESSDELLEEAADSVPRAFSMPDAETLQTSLVEKPHVRKTKRSALGGPESITSNRSLRSQRRTRSSSPAKRRANKSNPASTMRVLETQMKDQGRHTATAEAGVADAENIGYSDLNETERLAAIELAEKLKRRATTLKRRRRKREQKLKELQDMELQFVKHEQHQH